MNLHQRHLLKELLREGYATLKHTGVHDWETGIPAAEALLNDIKTYPHMFVLACTVDRQMHAGRAWAIPYKVGVAAGGHTFKHFRNLSHAQIERIFTTGRLHRFNIRLAECLYRAIQDIEEKYDGDASRIWAANPSSAAVIRRFYEFKGFGNKIAPMAANLLVRYLKVPMRDHSSIDISPDVQVRKFFTHHRFLRKEARNEELILLGRELHPEFPGILDYPAWRRGRELRS